MFPTLLVDAIPNATVTPPADTTEMAADNATSPSVDAYENKIAIGTYAPSGIIIGVLYAATSAPGWSGARAKIATSDASLYAAMPAPGRSGARATTPDAITDMRYDAMMVSRLAPATAGDAQWTVMKCAPLYGVVAMYAPLASLVTVDTSSVVDVRKHLTVQFGSALPYWSRVTPTNPSRPLHPAVG